MDNEKKRRIVIIAAVILGMLGLIYLGGMIGQFMNHYKTWLGAGGVGGNTEMKSVNFSPLACIPQAFTVNGSKGILGIIFAAAGIFLYVRFHDKFDGKEIDPRGFAKSKTGAYGTAGWMSETDMNEVLEISPVERPAELS